MIEPLADRRIGMSRRLALAGGAAGVLSPPSRQTGAIAQSLPEAQADEGEESFDSEASNSLPPGKWTRS